MFRADGEPDVEPDARQEPEQDLGQDLRSGPAGRPEEGGAPSRPVRARLRRGALRRSQALLVSPARWRARLVFWIGALVTGLVSVAFAHAADTAQHLFGRMISGPPWRLWATILLTPAGFIACALIAWRYFPGSQGSGIPQTIAARELKGRGRLIYLSIRTAVGKILLTVAGLLCGASIGREGPTVQIGAAIMLLSARLGGMTQARGLILAGSAAGIAAAFNTPLAGIVFAIEEMGRSYHARTNGLVLSTVVIAGLASLAIEGHYTYFGASQGTLALAEGLPLILATGVAGGVLGAGFSAGALWLTRRIRRWNPGSPARRIVAVAGIAGLVVAVAGIATHGAAFGTSYDHARAAIGGETLGPEFFLAKFAATLASTVSGIPGGLFAPSLSVGAGLGSVIGALIGTPGGMAAVLGMAGYFAGVVQAPMTAFVIVFEMTGNHDDILPVMATALIGYGVARILTPEPLYHGLARLWLADALRLMRSREQDNRPPSERG
ncbi:chloride channel protein [Haematobacter genomosp. 1]|uniref:Chloride channel protein n=2 Tax=Haematobacter genomosp. 1 TaxID=366618 RepID=A0A212A7L6_9RHOB|nr:chloride channel protein [Haematobacter genomosp. 1]